MPEDHDTSKTDGRLSCLKTDPARTSPKRLRILTLGRSFLWQLVLPRIVVLLTWALLNSVITLPLRLLYGLVLLDGILLLWQARCFLRSADAHIRDTGHLAPVWGGYLAILFAGFATVTLWWDAVLIASTPVEPDYAEQERLAREALYDLSITPDGRRLIFAGEIPHGLTRRIAAMMEDAPALREVALSGPGGLIYEARGVARLIRERALDTVAEGTCASACTLIFAAGQQRRLADQGVLGFHSYVLAYPGGLPQLDLKKEQDRDRAFLMRQGISAGFADRLYSISSNDMWFPDATELRDAGVLTQN
ncbi:hypothetical protein [Phaeobacter porticola]|uniref:Clp protease n=1 Tax=Phaeobacter porticola TaxID=1844006 RepID=A0A1L3I659_9RHOB|nr:hypothetical protein [Phaeobacter porticola]APG47542.1 Clp protease [Phaeobacter porticola]